MPTARMVVLNDNRPGPGLRNKWGWSLYIRTPTAAVLFDADTEPGVLCENSDKLGVRLEETGFAVLSHEHWDHYGGMPCIASRRPGLTVYAPPGLHLWARDIPVRVVENRRGLSPGERLYLTPPLSAGILLEHALTVDVGGGRSVVVVGCSHPGVDRLVEASREQTGLDPLLVIGGFHGPSREQLDRLAGMAEYISPAHCSGEEAVRYVEREYPGRLVLVRTGSVLEANGEAGTVRLLRF